MTTFLGGEMKDKTEKFKFSYTKFSLDLGHIKQSGIWGNLYYKDNKTVAFLH